MDNVSLDIEEIQTCGEYMYLSHFYATGNNNREIINKKMVGCLVGIW